MVSEGVANVSVNGSDLVSSAFDQILPVILEKLDPLMGLFKAVGVAFIVYVIYLVVKWFFRIRDRQRLKRVEAKVNEIDSKLDKFLGHKRESKRDKAKAKKSKKKKKN